VRGASPSPRLAHAPAQGLLACRQLRVLIIGAPLAARGADAGELERCVLGLPALQRLEVRGAAFEPRAVHALLAVQRAAERAGGRPVIEVVATPRS
jgi:hypothetical protein